LDSYESTTRRMRSELPGLCSLIQDTLPFYLEGDVSARSRQFVEQHLDECERCASFLAGGRSVHDHFRREQSARSVVMVRDRGGQELIADGRRRFLTLIVAVTSAVALLLILTLLGVGAMRSSRPDFGPASLPPTMVPPDARHASGPTATPFQPTVVPAP
jgi:predicted anti-sigma-YlaC factor YlaD